MLRHCRPPSPLPLRPSLTVQENSVISSSVARLSPVLAGTLLEALVGRLHRQPQQAARLVPWLRSLLLSHGAALASTPAGQVGTCAGGRGGKAAESLLGLAMVCTDRLLPLFILPGPEQPVASFILCRQHCSSRRTRFKSEHHHTARCWRCRGACRCCRQRQTAAAAPAAPAVHLHRRLCSRTRDSLMQVLPPLC